MRNFFIAHLVFALSLTCSACTAVQSPAPVLTKAPQDQIATQRATLTVTALLSPEMTSTQVSQPSLTDTMVITPPAATVFLTPQASPSAPEATQEGQFRDCSRGSTGLIPLMDMSASETYHGEEGGLYGEGVNEPPLSHRQRAEQASMEIYPRDAAGRRSPDGKIGLIAIGMSNARVEFDSFMGQARGNTAPSVVLVNGAQPGMVASLWADPDPRSDPWEFLARAVARAGLSPEQVQVAWLKEANGSPRPGRDDFPVYAQELRDDMAVMVIKARELYPNLRILYLSSRIYGGYSLIPLSPEPFAYEGAFSVRWLIQDQIQGGGATGVTYANAPVLLWGPYLWADGTNPRSDGLTWSCDDLMGDGVHPSRSGRHKVAALLLDFFTSDALAKSWFGVSP